MYTPNETNANVYYGIGSFFVVVAVLFGAFTAPATSVWTFVGQIQMLYFMMFLGYNFNTDTNFFMKSFGEIFNINFIPNIGSRNGADFSFMGIKVENQRPENLKIYADGISNNFLMNGLVRLFYLSGAWLVFYIMLTVKRGAESNAKTEGVRFTTTPVF